MLKWKGSAGVCVNDAGEILMVLQGTPEEEKKWTVPSGGREAGETFEDCCKREFFEETGYRVEIENALHIKKTFLEGYDVEVRYFYAKIIGGELTIQDPDELIHEIAWKSAEEIETLSLAFPEDKEFLLQYVK